MSAPIGNTCPDMDKAINRLSPMIKQIDKLREYDLENTAYILDLFNDCRYAMDCAIDAFEDMRSANDKLRSWGKEMEEEAENLQVQVLELTEQINHLNQ